MNVGAARYCGFVPARIARTMGEKTGNVGISFSADEHIQSDEIRFETCAFRPKVLR